MSADSLYKTFLWEGAYYGIIASVIGSVLGYVCLLYTSYPNGNLAIKLYEKDHGILIFWETLTTNLTGIRPRCV